MTGGARLRAYEAMGGPLGVLHDVLSWSATIPADAADPGAMQVSISQAAARTGFAGRPLLEGMELALELWDGDAWREPDNGRFIVVESAEDHNDAARVRNLSAPGFGWLLSKGKESVGPYAGDGDNKGRRQFLGVNVGIVILTLLQEWESRGGPQIETGFTTATDSRGQSWPSLPALWVSQGEALDATMGRLAANGSLYWWFEGRTLHAATTAPARERTNAVRLRKGREVSEAPSTETISDLIHAHTVIGANNVRVRDVDTSAGTPWGSWEGLVSDDRYTVTGAMRQRNQSALADAGRLRAQYTRDLTPLCEHRPGIDILPGDWITAPTHIPQERVRVASLLWRLDGDGLTSSLILNDSLLEASLARARRERLGEGGVNGGGSDVRPIPDGPDMRAPAAPQGLWATSDAYLDSEGAARGVIEASCEPVTTARPEDGSGALEVASYEWDLREGALGRWQRVATTSEPSAWIDDLDTGVTVHLRVRARGRYAAAPGVWSAGVSLVVESDVTPPPVPSAPVLSQRLGVIRVEWDGESSTGGDGVPPDYALTEVAVGQSSTPTEVAEAIYSGPGWALITEQPYGAETFIRLRSIDRSGNVSDWGAASSIVVEALVDEDLIDTTINERIEDAQGLAEQLRDNVIPPLVSDVDSALQAAAAAVIGSVIEYAVGSSETAPPSSGWSTATPVRTPGSLVWMRTQITYGDGSEVVTSPVLVTGNRGQRGEDGTSVTLQGSVPTAAQLPTLGVDDAGAGYIADDTGRLHVWSGSQWTDVGEIRGPQGEPGEDGDPGPQGVGVLTVTTWWQLTTGAEPSRPTTLTPSAAWSETEPGFVASRVLWRTERVVYTDGGWSWSPVSRVASYDAAAAAMAVAVTADRRVQAGVRAPVTADAEGAPVGALWHQYGGTPQRWMATWRWTGSTWVETPPMDPVLIPQIDIGTGTFGDLDGVRLRARTVTADAIAVGGIDDPIVLADGVVTARSVTASEDLSAKVGQFLTVTTGMLEANAVTADKVDAGAITGEKLHVNALNFKSATGLTLTSPTIQTTAETNRGVMLSSNGLEAWNTLGQRMVHIKTNGDAVLGSNAVVIDGSSGRVEIAGDFLTRANSWPNVEIRRNTWADFTGLRFNLDASSGQRGETPELKMNHFTYESYLAGSLFLSAKGPGGAVNRPEIRLGRHTTYGQIIEMQIAQSGSIRSYLRLTPGALRLSNSTGAYVLNGMRAGSSSFNITMDSSWTLSYAGSVRALKTDIAPLVPDDPYDVLRLQPITYRDRAEVGYHGDAAEHELGLIAEDVAEVAGEHTHLTPLLQHREGELVGLAYDRLPILLLPLLADMHRRITDLEGVADHEPDGDPDGAAAESAPVPDSGAGADDSDAARTTRRAPVRGERL